MSSLNKLNFPRNFIFYISHQEHSRLWGGEKAGDQQWRYFCCWWDRVRVSIQSCLSWWLSSRGSSLGLWFIPLPTSKIVYNTILGINNFDYFYQFFHKTLFNLWEIHTLNSYFFITRKWCVCIFLSYFFSNNKDNKYKKGSFNGIKSL